MLYWFREIYRTQLKRITFGIFLAFITAFSGVSLLMLSGWFITATALAGLSISAGLIIIFDMYMPGSGIRFFALSRTVGRYAERLYNHDTILRLVSVFRLTLFKKLSTLSYEELRQTSDSEWLSRLTADLDALDSLLLRFTITPIVSVLIIICATVFMHFIWPEYALTIGVYLLACGVVTTLVTIRRTTALAHQNASLLNAMRANVIEHLQGRFELKAQRLMEQHERHVVATLESLEKCQTAINHRVANIQLLLDILLVLGTSVLVFIGLMSVNAGQIDGPIAVMAVLMFVAIAELLQVLPTQYKQWGSTSFSANRLAPQIHHYHGTKTDDTRQAPVELSSSDTLKVVINQHPNILASANTPLTFSISGTQTLVISGKSGTGKSTVANIIAGVSSSTSKSIAEISLVVESDKPAFKLPANFAWANLGYLTQSNSILAGTLAYNLRLGIENTTDEQLWEALRMVELDAWCETLSDGLYSWLGETGAQVSGGQSRRITLARLLLRNPELVILDEVFNGLDESMAYRIWHNISPWLEQRKVVVLSHEFPNRLLQETHTNHIKLSY